jgi:hypothetical protein
MRKPRRVNGILAANLAVFRAMAIGHGATPSDFFS